MPPIVALTGCLLLIAILLLTDRYGDGKVSSTIWIPTVWVLIMLSKPISAWLFYADTLAMESPDVYLEGSPTDRSVSLVLIVLGILALTRKNIDWSQILRKNLWIVVFFLYGAVSIVWSDYPLVSLKRWSKTVGNIVMILVILTDQEPVLSVGAMIRRCSYVLIPLSIVLIKYYPDVARAYDRWTGEVQYLGATYSKNALGYLCLVCGLYFFWNFLSAFGNGRVPLGRKEMLLHISFLAATTWLLATSNSMTSTTCLALGCMFLMLVRLPVIRTRIRLIGIVLLGVAILASVVVMLAGGLSTVLAEMGRDPTLTGRTDLWSELLIIDINPLLGTGFEGFWLGERAANLWGKYWWRPTQAHNGYLELYLNLGLIGLGLLAVMVFSSYQNIRNKLITEFYFASFRMAMLMIALIYNVTEAAFKGLHIMWFMLLLVSMEYSHSISRRSKGDPILHASKRGVASVKTRMGIQHG